MLRFRPRFPLVPGLPYVARLDLTDLRPAVAAPPPAIHATLQLPAEIREPSTVVDQIYPTAAVLPGEPAAPLPALLGADESR